jgi:hypothetical protein
MGMLEGRVACVTGAARGQGPRGQGCSHAVRPAPEGGGAIAIAIDAVSSVK